MLTDPAETGAVTLALPQDIQAQAYDFPAALLRASACGGSSAGRPSRERIAEAVALLAAASGR